MSNDLKLFSRGFSPAPDLGWAAHRHICFLPHLPLFSYPTQSHPVARFGMGNVIHAHLDAWGWMWGAWGPPESRPLSILPPRPPAILLSQDSVVRTVQLSAPWFRASPTPSPRPGQRRDEAGQCPGMTLPGRELGAGKERARASRGPAPSPDAALLVRGDWRVRPRDEWGDRGGGGGGDAESAGRGRAVEGHRAAAAPPCAAGGQRSPRPASGGGGPRGWALVPREGRAWGGPEVIGAPEGCDPDQGLGGWGREKLRLSLRPQAKGVPASWESLLGTPNVLCKEGLALRSKSYGWNPRLDIPVWTRSFFPFLHQYHFVTLYFTFGHSTNIYCVPT